jgi:hypothetical protein
VKLKGPREEAVRGFSNDERMKDDGDAMKTNTIVSVRMIALRMICNMAIDALLGGACGALYGFVFGGFGAIVHNEPARLISIAGYFALCGAAAGAVIGACGALLEGGAKATDFERRTPEVGAKRHSSIETVRHLMVSSDRQSEISLLAAVGPNRRQALSVASNHPLSC